MDAKDTSPLAGATIAATAAPAETPGHEHAATSNGWAAKLKNAIQRTGTTPRQRPVAAASQASRDGVTILYGTETGNCMRVTRDLHHALERAGVPNRWLNTGKYDLNELTKERCLLIAISTYDDEEPPEDALLFMGYMLSAKAPRLPQLQYGVLALGATCYSQFCTVGKQLDARLVELGATRLLELGLCDTEFQSTAAAWIAHATQVVNARLSRV